MAKTPESKLSFIQETFADSIFCPDCAKRQVSLPGLLLQPGDDLDWQVRDYDGFRLFMMEELSARFQSRNRWTPADVETTLVEAIAFYLDLLSDMADRVAGEAFLETARRPETIRRLLALIGYDALDLAQKTKAPPFDRPANPLDLRTNAEKLDAFWLAHPEKMDQARQEGPARIQTQKRMVTLDDYQRGLTTHPLVAGSRAWDTWSGSWLSIHCAVILANRYRLDDAPVFSDEVWKKIEAFHTLEDIFLFPRNALPTLRALIQPFIDARRMAGTEVILQDAVEVGIQAEICLTLLPTYFYSEVCHAVEHILGTEPGGFFEPGRLKFGEDLYASDLLDVILSVEGVDTASINRFKRLGDRFPDQSGSGRIPLNPLEVAVCDNHPGNPERGYTSLSFHGGKIG